MTRINVVAVQDLSDKHLLAEYKEITRITAGLHKAQKPLTDIPPRYCLGTGHMKFFYDKMRWIADRYANLAAELTKRGVTINQYKFRGYLQDMLQFQDTPYFNNYDPTPEDKYLNMARLVKRSNNKAAIEEMLNDN